MLPDQKATAALLLDPRPQFLHGLAAQLRKENLNVIEVVSPDAALKKLANPGVNDGWGMFIVNEAFLQNGAKKTPVQNHRLLHALRSRFVNVPVAVLSGDKISEADDSYKGLRLGREGRAGYTTYIFKNSEHAPGVPTRPNDVYWIIELFGTVSRLLRNEGWLEHLAKAWNFHVGISIVDRSYRLQYVNAFQRRISCRNDIQIGGICWMEYNRTFHQVQHCPWCPVAKACLATKPRSSTTISPLWRSDLPGLKKAGILAQAVDGMRTPIAEYRFYEVRAFPIRDPQTKRVIATLELVFLRTEEMLDKCRGAILEGPHAFRKSMEKMLAACRTWV